MTRSGTALDPSMDELEPMTVDAFLDWSERQPDGERHELVDGRPLEMPAERNRHALVKARVWRLLEEAARTLELPCTVFPGGVTIVVQDARAARTLCSSAEGASISMP